MGKTTSVEMMCECKVLDLFTFVVLLKTKTLPGFPHMGIMRVDSVKKEEKITAPLHLRAHTRLHTTTMQVMESHLNNMLVLGQQV